MARSAVYFTCFSPIYRLHYIPFADALSLVSLAYVAKLEKTSLSNE